MHRKVKEILQNLTFLCPGCKIRYKYDDINDHALKCDKVDPKLKLTREDVVKIIGGKLPAIDTLPY